MLDVAIRRSDGTTTVDLARRCAPALPVCPALATVLPAGLRRGSTVSVSGSISLVLALLGAASAQGAWCALVGFPSISAEAAEEYGIELSRLALVPNPGAGWTSAVGALIDALDVVAARPPARPAARELPMGDIRRLSARARNRDTLLVPVLTGADSWVGAEVALCAQDGRWSGIGEGTGRLRGRLVDVSVTGRGAASRPTSTTLWLPAPSGGIEVAPALAPVIDLAG